jgi:hypothetical protein
MSSPFTFNRAPPPPAPARRGESHGDRVKREAVESFGLVARLICGESRLVVGEDEEVHELVDDRAELAGDAAAGGVVIDTTADVCPTCGGTGRLGARDHEIACPVCSREAKR